MCNVSSRLPEDSKPPKEWSTLHTTVRKQLSLTAFNEALL